MTFEPFDLVFDHERLTAFYFPGMSRGRWRHRFARVSNQLLSSSLLCLLFCCCLSVFLSTTIWVCFVVVCPLVLSNCCRLFPPNPYEPPKTRMYPQKIRTDPRKTYQSIKTPQKPVRRLSYLFCPKLGPPSPPKPPKNRDGDIWIRLGWWRVIRAP